MKTILKTIFLFLLILVFISQVTAITKLELDAVKSGNIAHLKLEWNGKVYVEGDCVIAYRIGDSLQVASTNPNNNFVGAFSYIFFTSVEFNNLDSLMAENRMLKAKLVNLTLLIKGLYDVTMEGN